MGNFLQCLRSQQSLCGMGRRKDEADRGVEQLFTFISFLI